MHITNSSQYLGYVDENIEVSSSLNKVTGWAVSKANNLIFTADIKVIDPSNNTPIPCKIENIVRPDVHAFYLGGKPFFNGAPVEETKYFYSGFSIIYPSNISTLVITIGDTSVFTVKNNVSALEDLDSIIRLNKNTKPELIVVDNFYEDPDRVREYAMRQEFKTNELYHKGNRTQKSYIPSWAKDEFSRLLNKKVTAFVGATGVFQYCVAKDNVVYHYDTQEYAAMVYLTPDAPLQTGTQTYRSKHTGLFTAATDLDAQRLGLSKEEIDQKSFNGNNFYDRHNMELVDSVANVYNRCVIFNARALHSATSYFGDRKENARLFHLYFFDC
jgi:hypothetical protein